VKKDPLCCFLGSTQVSDLAPIAGLSALQKLNLAYSRQVSDLAPLASLSALQIAGPWGPEVVSKWICRDYSTLGSPYDWGYGRAPADRLPGYPGWW